MSDCISFSRNVLFRKEDARVGFFFLNMFVGFDTFPCNQDTEGNLRLPGGKQRTMGKSNTAGADHIYIYICNSTELWNRNRNLRMEINLSIL